MSRTLGAFFAALVLPWAMSAQPSPVDGTLPCLQPVDGLTWMRWSDNQSDTRPVVPAASAGRSSNRGFPGQGDVTGMRILSWNVHVGAGRLEELLPRLLEDAARENTGLTILLQETFRTGDAVPESYPATLKVPQAIRPRRPTMDVREIADRFGLVSRLRAVDEKRLCDQHRRARGPRQRDPVNGTAASMCARSSCRSASSVASLCPRSSLGAKATARADPRRVHAPRYQWRSGRAGGRAQRAPTFLADFPLFIGGDLNRGAARMTTRSWRSLSRFPLASCGTGRTNRWPLRLDVLVPMVASTSCSPQWRSEMVTRSCETLRDARGSDHLPLLMTLRS